ncbi:uncharacterized protein PHACADRAFT_192348 [Phanerochaete carnosa HHB-10118-sp]|uniref:Uncharacterized protein n=1 Tax=Phanerochaete carnosa (strain HHB-10118-sp) TaxID=650164 RepID=K5W7N1_PHACS|nr:uncharacterized protein PHACADRAFT_192348 [Phanerochaete carnosa HHB-10118-sp]EKM59953.1 hypothetical protein PHACADRAFT_192348 [Phanerochaete carnosa HHB-10118-sp]
MPTELQSRTPSSSSATMQYTTGADLPPEMLSRILYYLTPPDKRENRARGGEFEFEFSRGEYRDLKRGLAAPSLVCNHWSEAIRPLLFSRLSLRSAEDVRMLRNVVDSPQFRTSSLSDAIQLVSIFQEVASTKPAWLYHVHWLTSRLQETSFECYVESPADGPKPTIGHRDLFRSLPRVPPPSSLRLAELVLSGLQFASATELALLVDSFPSLQRLICDRLIFLDSSSVVQSRRSPRRPSSSLVICRAYQCEGMPFSTKVALASDVLSVATRVGLDAHTWDAVLHALLALAPGTFQAVRVGMRQPEDKSLKAVDVTLAPSEGDMVSLCGSYILASIEVRQASAGQGAGPPSAFIDSIHLSLSFPDAQVRKSLRFDAFRIIIDAPLFDCLYFASGKPDGPEFETLKAILYHVLQGTQLYWALKSGKLKLVISNPVANPVDISVFSSDIMLLLQASLKDTIDDEPVTVDAAELVDNIIYAVQEGEGDEYLEELLTARASLEDTIDDEPITVDAAELVDSIIYAIQQGEGDEYLEKLLTACASLKDTIDDEPITVDAAELVNSIIYAIQQGEGDEYLEKLLTACASLKDTIDDEPITVDAAELVDSIIYAIQQGEGDEYLEKLLTACASLKDTIDDELITVDAAELVDSIIYAIQQGEGDEYLEKLLTARASLEDTIDDELEELLTSRASGTSADASSGTVAVPSAPEEA